MRALPLLFLVACGSTAPVHEVIDCDQGPGRCEYGCRNGQPPTDIGFCFMRAANGSDLKIGCQETFFTDGRDPNHRGCCVSDGDVLRFRECCEPVVDEGGSNMTYECPE